MDCSSKRQGMIIQVLNGFYPSQEISRMNTAVLAKFVECLVKSTSNTSRRGHIVNVVEPNWWPKDIIFKHKLHSPPDDVLYMRPILKLLIVKCSEYFRNTSFKEKWLPGLDPDRYFQREENDENCLDVINRGVKRKGIDSTIDDSVKKLRVTVKSKGDLPLTEVNECFEGAHEPVIPSLIPTPNQNQFLEYLSLQSKHELPLLKHKPNTSNVVGSFKLANCPHIPFSSNVGRIMIANEHHSIPQELKLRRLEKTEWYLSGKSSIKPSVQDYDVTYSEKAQTSSYNYKFPRRQFYQRHMSLYFTPFVLKHLQSSYVRLERLNIVGLERKLKVYVRRVSINELSPFICKNVKVVMIRGETEKTDSNAIRRYSPRLRSL